MELRKKAFIGLVVAVLSGCSGGSAAERDDGGGSWDLAPESDSWRPVGTAFVGCSLAGVLISDTEVYGNFSPSEEEQAVLDLFDVVIESPAVARAAEIFLQYYDVESDTVRMNGVSSSAEQQFGASVCMMEDMLSVVDSESLSYASAQTGPKTAVSEDGTVTIMFAYDGVDDEFTFIAEPVD